MNREFRCYTRKEGRKKGDVTSKLMAKYKNNTENISDYEKLSYLDIQNITSIQYKLLRDYASRPQNSIAEYGGDYQH